MEQQSNRESGELRRSLEEAMRVAGNLEAGEDEVDIAATAPADGALVVNG